MALYTRIKGPVGYTTIGSPTMTDGIATGFSSSNYYKLDTPFKPGNNAWEFVIRGKVNNFSSRHTLFSYALTNTRSVQLSTTVTGTLVTYISSNGTSGNLANGTQSTLTIQTNTWYYFKVRFTKTAYHVLVSEDNENWTTYITVNSSTPVWQGTYFSIGYNLTTYPEPMDGYIDFNNSYIQIEDTAFWGYSVSRAKILTSPFVKYTVDGSPTITDGVLKDISRTNKCYTSSSLPEFETLEIVIKAKRYTWPSESTILPLCAFGAYNSSLRITTNAYSGENQGTRLFSDSSNVIVSIDNSKFNVRQYGPLGYYTRLIVTKNTADYTYELGVSADSTTWVTAMANFEQNICSGRPVQFLQNSSGTGGSNAEMSFNQTYIKVDGQYLFRGDMQNVETWTPHIKDN